MIKKIWIHRARSFKEAEEFDHSYYRAMSWQEKLDTVQFLRELYYKIKMNLSREKKKILAKRIKLFSWVMNL